MADGWADIPLISGRWIDLHKDIVEDLYARLVDEPRFIERFLVRGDYLPSRARWTALDFYTHTVLIDMQLHPRRTAHVPQARLLSFLFSDAGIVPLDGKGAPLNEYNQHRLDLKPSTVADYLRFYCAYVHGQEGPFTIMDAPSTLLPYIETPPTAPGSLARIAPKMTITPTEADDDLAFRCNATILYGQSLFRAEFELLLTGEVSMPSSKPIRSKLQLRSRRYAGSLRSPPGALEKVHG